MAEVKTRNEATMVQDTVVARLVTGIKPAVDLFEQSRKAQVAQPVEAVKEDAIRVSDLSKNGATDEKIKAQVSMWLKKNLGAVIEGSDVGVSRGAPTTRGGIGELESVSFKYTIPGISGTTFTGQMTTEGVFASKTFPDGSTVTRVKYGDKLKVSGTPTTVDNIDTFLKSKNGDITSFGTYTDNSGNAVNYFKNDATDPQRIVEDFVVSDYELGKTPLRRVSAEELQKHNGILNAHKGTEVYFGKKIEEEVFNKLPSDVRKYILEGK